MVHSCTCEVLLRKRYEYDNINCIIFTAGIYDKHSLIIIRHPHPPDMHVILRQTGSSRHCIIGSRV